MFNNIDCFFSFGVKKSFSSSKLNKCFIRELILDFGEILNLKISSKLKISSLVTHLTNLLEKKDFFIPKEKKHSMLLNINNLIYRLEPNDKELRILASIISSLSKNKI